MKCVSMSSGGSTASSTDPYPHHLTMYLVIGPVSMCHMILKTKNSCFGGNVFLTRLNFQFNFVSKCWRLILAGFIGSVKRTFGIICAISFSSTVSTFYCTAMILKVLAVRGRELLKTCFDTTSAVQSAVDRSGSVLRKN